MLRRFIFQFINPKNPGDNFNNFDLTQLILKVFEAKIFISQKMAKRRITPN